MRTIDAEVILTLEMLGMIIVGIYLNCMSVKDKKKCRRKLLNETVIMTGFVVCVSIIMYFIKE